MDICIAKAALNTITSFVNWASFESILSRDNMLLKTLLLFLENKELKLLAAECLCTIFERKVFVFLFYYWHIYRIDIPRENDVTNDELF